MADSVRFPVKTMWGHDDDLWIVAFGVSLLLLLVMALLMIASWLLRWNVLKVDCYDAENDDNDETTRIWPRKIYVASWIVDVNFKHICSENHVGSTKSPNFGGAATLSSVHTPLSLWLVIEGMLITV